VGINNSLHRVPTKIIPEELVPVWTIGKMVPNRNPDKCFAEAEEGATLPPTMVLSLKKIPAADALDRVTSLITYVWIVVI
jgi:catalase